MKRLSAERLGQMALNDTKPQSSMKARRYVYAKGAQILGRTPRTLSEGVLAIKKHRETGFISA